jgi:hypothetical protein
VVTSTGPYQPEQRGLAARFEYYLEIEEQCEREKVTEGGGDMDKFKLVTFLIGTRRELARKGAAAEERRT